MRTVWVRRFCRGQGLWIALAVSSASAVTTIGQIERKMSLHGCSAGLSGETEIYFEHGPNAGPHWIHLGPFLLRKAWPFELQRLEQIASDPLTIQNFFLHSKWNRRFLDPFFGPTDHGLLDTPPTGKMNDRISSFVIEDLRHRQLIGMGVMREMPSQNRWRIGYAIDPASRRQGLARQFLKSLVGYIRDRRSVPTVEAWILEKNRASRSLVTSLGFETEDGQPTLLGQSTIRFVLPPDKPLPP